MGPTNDGRYTLIVSSLPLREEAESQRSRADCEAAKLSHIRSLAQHILQQRSEVEHFLLDALQHVKREVVANRYPSDSSHWPYKAQPVIGTQISVLS